MTRLRIAVVGAGAYPSSRAREYLATVARLEGHYVLAAVCDKNAEVAAEAARQYGAERHYTDVRALFDDQKPDVVLSMTPKDSHVVIALTAARRGVHVITEIPVALTRRHARAIAAACREHGVLWEVAEQVPFWPREQLKQRVVAAGLLGRVVHARLWYQTGPYHGFAAVRKLVGADPARVLGYCGEVPAEPYVAYGGEAETTLKWESGTVEFANGVVCLFEKPPRVAPHPTRTYPQGWEIEGTGGFFDRHRLALYAGDELRTYELAEEHAEVDGVRVLERMRVDTPEPVVWENPFKRYGVGDRADNVAKASVLTSFHAAVVGGGEPQYGAAEAQVDWELCLAVRESAHRGNAWVALPLGAPTALEEEVEAEFRRRYRHDPIEETEKLLDAPFGRSATLWKPAHWL